LNPGYNTSEEPVNVMILQLTNVHPSWLSILKKAIDSLDLSYLETLQSKENWLPGPENIFSAFSLPLPELRYILWGESPYPRAKSANGHAFWDAAVSDIWSDTGFSKAVNKATSLRNILKMLLVARGDLKANSVTQSDIAAIDKSELISQLAELFQNLRNHGFLLLNASLVLSDLPIKKEAQQWQPFMQNLLAELTSLKPDLELVLFGNIAKVISKLAAPDGFKQFVAEHPYNISFIHNPEVLEFFRPFDLLKK